MMAASDRDSSARSDSARDCRLVLVGQQVLGTSVALVDDALGLGVDGGGGERLAEFAADAEQATGPEVVACRPVA